jgi:hypothetical protein
MSGKVKAIVFASSLALLAVILSCSEDSNYDQRTVVYVSSIANDRPYMVDVLCQGDSIYNPDGVTFKYIDDFVTEDYIPVVFTNKPYNGIVDPAEGALGQFLVTGYDVSFMPYGGAAVPVAPFSGTTSVLVPSGESVSASVLLCPFEAKSLQPLLGLAYQTDGYEIMARAHIVFHGEEIQSGRKVDFEANVSVNFADPLVTKTDEDKLNK